MLGARRRLSLSCPAFLENGLGVVVVAWRSFSYVWEMVRRRQRRRQQLMEKGVSAAARTHIRKNKRADEEKKPNPRGAPWLPIGSRWMVVFDRSPNQKNKNKRQRQKLRQLKKKERKEGGEDQGIACRFRCCCFCVCVLCSGRCPLLVSLLSGSLLHRCSPSLLLGPFISPAPLLHYYRTPHPLPPSPLCIPKQTNKRDGSRSHMPCTYLHLLALPSTRSPSHAARHEGVRGTSGRGIRRLAARPAFVLCWVVLRCVVGGKEGRGGAASHNRGARTHAPRSPSCGGCRSRQPCCPGPW